MDQQLYPLQYSCCYKVYRILGLMCSIVIIAIF